LALLATAAVGYWTMTGSDVLTKAGWVDFKDEVLRYTGWPPSRHLAHLILGLALVVLPLLCAMLAWLSPRKRGMLIIFSSLLVLVVAAQVWMGVLLTFDGGSGTLTHFKTVAEKAAAKAAKKAKAASDSDAAPSAPTTAPAAPDSTPIQPKSPTSAPASDASSSSPAEKAGDAK
jgi:hypothetical protein